MVSVMDYAVECVEAVVGRYGERGEVAKAFRSRARQFAETVYYNDLAYVVALLASKSGANPDLYTDVAPGGDPRRIVEAVEEAKLKKEEGSYALYGAMLVGFLFKSGVLKKKPDGLGGLLKELKGLGERASRYALEYARWVKRLAEALIEAE